MKLSTIFVAAVHGLNTFTSKLLESPEFKALEVAATPLAVAAVTAALAPEVGPLAPVAASAVIAGAEDALSLVGAATARVAVDTAPKS